MAIIVTYVRGGDSTRTEKYDADKVKPGYFPGELMLMKGTKVRALVTGYSSVRIIDEDPTK